MVSVRRYLILQIPRMQAANFLIKIVISKNRKDHSVFNRSTSEVKERSMRFLTSYLRQVRSHFDWISRIEGIQVSLLLSFLYLINWYYNIYNGIIIWYYKNIYVKCIHIYNALCIWHTHARTHTYVGELRITTSKGKVKSNPRYLLIKGILYL